MKDADSVFVYPVYEKNSKGIYVYGNVINPGFWELKSEGTSVGDMFNYYIKKSGGIEHIFLPDTYFKYALIKRFKEDLTYQIIQVNLTKELQGQTATILKDSDELYIFDQRIISGAPFVQIEGEPILNPGKYTYYKGLSAEDLIVAAGIVSGGRIDITKIKVGAKSVNLITNPFYKLNPFDNVLVYDLNITKPKKYARIYGEVNNPGEYEIDVKTTTLKDLIDMAGGFTQKAALNKIEIIQYFIKDGVRDKKLITHNDSVKKLYKMVLKKDDEVRIFKIPNWDERKSIEI